MSKALPSFSPSKLTTFLACPHKYYWSYLNPRGRWYRRARSVFSFGNSLHAVLERFHDSNETGVETTEQAMASLEENWHDAGYESVDQMSEAIGEGKAMLQSYLEDLEKSPPTGTTLAVEKSLRWERNGYALVGRIDRLEETNEGGLEIIDYKTGRGSVSIEDVRFDFSMSLYQLLVAKNFPQRPITASIIALRSGEKASYAMTEAELSEFAFDVDEVVRALEGTHWEEKAPRKKALCDDCDFLPLCRRHPEFGT